MTTPNQIVLPTSPETRAKATAMGAVLKYEPGDFPIEQWEYEGFLVTVNEAGNAEITVNGFDAEADAHKFLTLLSSLGIQTTPPGMVLVPGNDLLNLANGTAFAGAKSGCANTKALALKYQAVASAALSQENHSGAPNESEGKTDA